MEIPQPIEESEAFSHPGKVLYCQIRQNSVRSAPRMSGTFDVCVKFT